MYSDQRHGTRPLLPTSSRTDGVTDFEGKDGVVIVTRELLDLAAPQPFPAHRTAMLLVNRRGRVLEVFWLPIRKVEVYLISGEALLWSHGEVLVPKKEERRNQGRSTDPDQGAQRTAPGRRPSRGAAKHCLFAERAFRLSLVVSVEAVT